MIDGGLARYLKPGDQTISVRVTGHLFYEGCSGVTGICVSQGCVFPAHISLGMRVSPHTYH